MYIVSIARPTKQAGFTLVELSIVLFIIGIIMASVMKGQDIIASARATKVQQGYFLKWLEIVNGYHEITGKILCDGVENGGPTGPYAGPEDGFMDGITYDNDYSDSRRSTLFIRLRQTGIDPCTMINGNLFDLDVTNPSVCENDLNIYEYMLNSENTGKQQVTLGLTNLNIDLDDNDTTSPVFHRNIIIFLNVPLDYAIRLDKTLDGYADGEHGKCVNMSGNVIGRPEDNPYTTLGNAGLSNGNNRTSHPWPGPDSDSSSIDNLFALGIMLDY